MIGVGTTAMGFCNKGERLGSTPNKMKWGFIDKELGRGVGQWVENYQEGWATLH